MGAHILECRETVDAQQYDMLRDGDYLDSYLGNSARQKMADLMVRDRAVRVEHLEPDNDRPWLPFAHVFTWRISVNDAEDTEALQRQLDEARAGGLREAAGMARKMAAMYRSLRASGPCGGVLADSADSLARSLDDAANKAVANALD